MSKVYNDSVPSPGDIATAGKSYFSITLFPMLPTGYSYLENRMNFIGQMNYKDVCCVLDTDDTLCWAYVITSSGAVGWVVRGCLTRISKIEDVS